MHLQHSVGKAASSEIIVAVVTALQVTQGKSPPRQWGQPLPALQEDQQAGAWAPRELSSPALHCPDSSSRATRTASLRPPSCPIWCASSDAAAGSRGEAARAQCPWISLHSGPERPGSQLSSLPGPNNNGLSAPLHSRDLSDLGPAGKTPLPFLPSAVLLRLLRIWFQKKLEVLLFLNYKWKNAHCKNIHYYKYHLYKV